MTQEEKELLLKDLCGRLPYGVILQLTLWEEKTTDCRLTGIDEDGNLTADVPADCAFSVEGVKPYLRPMSSMTEEENAIFDNISNKDRGFEEDEDGWIRCDSIHTKWGVCPDGCAKLLDYLNSIHIDYRGLIEKGLALEAQEGMYK